MNNPTQSKSRQPAGEAETREYITLYLGDHAFGIPVLQVQDVLGPQQITRIPLARGEVAGSLNLRGRIVTAIDLRERLGLPPRQSDKDPMSIVIELHGELYSLIVDGVGEVLALDPARTERNPPSLDARWREVSTGIQRLEDRLLVLVDVARMLDFTVAEAA